MDDGCHVLVHARSSIKPAQQLIDDATARNGVVRGTVVQADLTVDEDVERLLAEVQAHPLVVEHGLFGLVHNASYYHQGPFEDVDLATYRSLNRLHMDAPYLLTQALLPQLERAGGSVVAIVDTSWGRAWEGLAHYTSSKAGLRQLMLNLAGELSGRLRVNCLAPGAIMAADWEAEHFAKVLEKVPLGRSGSAGRHRIRRAFSAHQRNAHRERPARRWRVDNERMSRFLQVLPSCPVSTRRGG